MATETEVVEEEKTQEQEENRTVSIEQFEELFLKNEELEKKFELSQKSNSGLDSKITELQKISAMKEKAREDEKKSVHQKNADAIGHDNVQ